ncbi:hypothetical protein CMI37_11845 [Candidatus Pacearchaeota archaeon]|nr:hypothetical protein [Candidatus Pacearchaeota archaeon]|tara:strand:- start:2578 stop:2766 length:189 start_codon:yes stop_codon:yes gene_type:complete
MSIKEFIKLVDNKLESELGLSIHDLPDIPISDVYFDEDLSDNELARMADEVVSDVKYDNGLT